MCGPGDDPNPDGNDDAIAPEPLGSPLRRGEGFTDVRTQEGWVRHMTVPPTERSGELVAYSHKRWSEVVAEGIGHCNDMGMDISVSSIVGGILWLMELCRLGIGYSREGLDCPALMIVLTAAVRHQFVPGQCTDAGNLVNAIVARCEGRGFAQPEQWLNVIAVSVAEILCEGGFINSGAEVPPVAMKIVAFMMGNIVDVDDQTGQVGDPDPGEPLPLASDEAEGKEEVE